MIGKSQNQKNQISKDYFTEKYKYIKAVKYEIDRMLNLNCYDKKSMNLLFENSINLKLFSIVLH